MKFQFISVILWVLPNSRQRVLPFKWVYYACIEPFNLGSLPTLLSFQVEGNENLGHVVFVTIVLLPLHFLSIPLLYHPRRHPHPPPPPPPPHHHHYHHHHHRRHPHYHPHHHYHHHYLFSHRHHRHHHHHHHHHLYHHFRRFSFSCLNPYPPNRLSSHCRPSSLSLPSCLSYLLPFLIFLLLFLCRSRWSFALFWWPRYVSRKPLAHVKQVFLIHQRNISFS